jgi:hypothetical protein
MTIADKQADAAAAVLKAIYGRDADLMLGFAEVGERVSRVMVPLERECRGAPQGAIMDPPLEIVHHADDGRANDDGADETSA